MSLFGAFGVASSGMDVYQTWLDAISGNVANANDTSPTSQSAYQERYLEIAPVATGGVGEGVQVTNVALGSAQGQLSYEPNNPLADAQGMVRHPSIDLGDQMVQMVVAERAYQANVSSVTQARQAYQSALELGA